MTGLVIMNMDLICEYSSVASAVARVLNAFARVDVNIQTVTVTLFCYI